MTLGPKNEFIRKIDDDWEKVMERFAQSMARETLNRGVLMERLRREPVPPRLSLQKRMKKRIKVFAYRIHRAWDALLGKDDYD